MAEFRRSLPDVSEGSPAASQQHGAAVCLRLGSPPLPKPRSLRYPLAWSGKAKFRHAITFPILHQNGNLPGTQCTVSLGSDNAEPRDWFSMFLRKKTDRP